MVWTLLQLVFFFLCVFYVSVVLREVGCCFPLAGAFCPPLPRTCSAFGSNQPPYLYPDLLSAFCQNTVGETTGDIERAPRFRFQFN